MTFAIVYTDPDGRDFSETVPWILDGFGTEEECKTNAEELKLQGFQNVTPFAFHKAPRDENITWEFVQKQQI